MTSPTHYLVNTNALTAITNYLATKPYGEVVELFAMLRDSKPYQPAPSHPNDAAFRADQSTSPQPSRDSYPEIPNSGTGDASFGAG